jgi:hypothetical protein
MMSATTLPLVAAILLMAAIEIVAVDCNGQRIYVIILPFCVGCVASYNMFRYQRRKFRFANG